MGQRRTLLLLGAAGFAGAHVRSAAEAAGLRVACADRSEGSADLRFDLLDPASIAAVVRAASPDAILNLAGSASVAGSWKRPTETFAVNAAGVLNLLEAALEESPSAHLTCVSSAEVYGQLTEDKLPLDEELAMEPVTPYGASKAAMEIVCAQYARARGLRIALLRPFNQIGPGQSPEFVVAGLARQIAAAEAAGDDEVELAAGNLSAARDFTDIRDTAGAYVSVVQRELTGTFNLCSGHATSVRTLIEEMGAATPLRLRITQSSELMRPSDPPLVYGSPSRLRAAAGWEPRIPLSRSVADVLDWWRSKLGVRSLEEPA